MKKEGVSKKNLKLAMKIRAKKYGEIPADDHFEYNLLVGCVLLAQRRFLTTPTEMLLAKCAYCQSIEHGTTKCHDKHCPLYDYMSEKKRYLK